MSSEPQPSHPLIQFLLKNAEDRAMLAELRRGLGTAPGEAPGMFPYIVPFIRGEYEEDNLYLIASLFALHPVNTSVGNMGKHLHDCARAVGDDAATTRRFTQLMRQRRDALDTPLRQHIALLKAHDIAVNWNQLLRDLGYWGHEDHFVQRQWAGSYWPPEKNKTASADQ